MRHLSHHGHRPGPARAWRNPGPRRHEPAPGQRGSFAPRLGRWLAVGLLLAAGPALAQALLVRDDRGREHRFDTLPQRFVSLMPSLTETAWVLGAGTRLVGVDRSSDWPAEIAALPRLGGLDDARIEAIARLKPDVVLASTSARSLERLEALGIRVLRLNSDTHADVRRTLSLVAQLLGRPAEGERMWAQLEGQLAAAAARVPASLRGRRVYFEVGGGPYAAGSSSFVGETLARLGMANVVPAEMGPFPKLNPEWVVRARPDVVMGTQRGQADLLARPGWQAIPAAQNQRLCGFDSKDYDILVRPGPRLGQGAALLADCLQRLAREGTR